MVDAVRDTPDAIEGGSLVATDRAGAVIGHALLSRGALLAGDGTERPIWMLGPFSVHPDVQGRGVGARLMRAVIDLATRRGQPVVCLLGHASYYPHFGFEPGRALGILPPMDWPDEAWQVLRLPAWTPELRGTARYAAAFGIS